MAQTSHLSRYHPAVVAATGLAVACAIYALYTTLTHQPPKTTLQRRNAVHHPRGERRRPVVHYAPPDQFAPLGYVIVHVSERGICPLNVDDGEILDLPEMFEGYELLRPLDQRLLQRDVQVTAIESVLNACHEARAADQILRLAERNLDGLREALHGTLDLRAVHASSRAIAEAVPSIDASLIDEVVAKFIRHDVVGVEEAPWPPPTQHAESDDETVAETDAEREGGADEGPSQGLKGLLYHIAETDARRQAYEHRGIHCESCGERPIRGIRWHCLNCADFDLCSTCEAHTAHPRTHVFAKITIPLPILSQPPKELPLWYPGDPRKLHDPLPTATKKQLEATHGLAPHQLDAHLDQFLALANVPWPADPHGLHAALDHRAFVRALSSPRWPRRFRPNALYDRMFAFYDTNADDLIGVDEFLSGITYLRGPKRLRPLTRALRGFDVDGDGYVDRADFLRLLRAKHEVQKLLVADMVASHAGEQTRGAMETLRSAQPISSILSTEEIPPGGEMRVSGGKTTDAAGEVHALEGERALLENEEAWGRVRQRRRRRASRREVARQLTAASTPHVSRFEEMLASPPRDENHADGLMPSSLDDENPPNQTATVPPFSPTETVSSASASDPDEQDSDPPLNQDVLYTILESGFNEILDPLFAAREEADAVAIATRAAREQWRTEIDVAKQDAEARREMMRRVEADPLMATAASLDGIPDRAAEGGSGGEEESREDGSAALAIRAVDLDGTEHWSFRAGLDAVPTDPVSLERWEAEIARRPLGELLDAAGYEALDGEGRGDKAEGQGEGEEWETSEDDDDDADGDAPGIGASQQQEHSPGDAVERDPTLPQNRPDSSPTPPAPHPPPQPPGSQPTRLTAAAIDDAAQNAAALAPPSPGRLLALAEVDQHDAKMREARGGVAGRLSLAEVEEAVERDSSRELRGLVVGWLEWASF